MTTFGERNLLFIVTDEEVLECTLIRMGDVLRDIYDVVVSGPQQKIKNKKIKQQQECRNTRSKIERSGCRT